MFYSNKEKYFRLKIGEEVCYNLTENDGSGMRRFTRFKEGIVKGLLIRRDGSIGFIKVNEDIVPDYDCYKVIKK